MRAPVTVALHGSIPKPRHSLTDGRARGAARRAARRAWRPASACAPPCSSAAACPCTACRAPPELETFLQQRCRGFGNGTGVLARAVPVGLCRPSVHVRTALCLLFPWGVHLILHVQHWHSGPTAILYIFICTRHPSDGCSMDTGLGFFSPLTDIRTCSRIRSTYFWQVSTARYT